MTDQLVGILADLSGAQRALRESSEAFDAAVGHMRNLLDTITVAHRAQMRAMDAVIAATDKALTVIDGRAH